MVCTKWVCMTERKCWMVGAGEHPISRVLSCPVISLVPFLRRGTSDRTRESAGRLILPYSILLRMGLAKPPCCHDAGGLLHHRFSFSLYALRRRWESSFLRRFPSDHSARPLAGIPPSGARTFLTRAASSTSRDRLAHSAVQECSTPSAHETTQHARSTR